MGKGHGVARETQRRAVRMERKITHPQDFLPQSRHTNQQRSVTSEFPGLSPSAVTDKDRNRVTGRDHSLQMEGDSNLDQCGCHGDERGLGSGCLLEAELAEGTGRWDGKRRTHVGCLQDFLAPAVFICYYIR